MSIFAQRLSRLPCTYSTLLRLWKKHDYPQRLIALPGYKFGTFTSSNVIEDNHNEVNPPEVLRENLYVRNYFLHSRKYNESVMQNNNAHAHVTNEKALELLNQDWNQETDSKLLSAIKNLNFNIRYSDEKIPSHLYENMFATLCNRHQMMSDDDLMVLIRQLVSFRQFRNQPFYVQFCGLLHTECIKRFMNLSISNMLLLCDMLNEISQRRNNEYIWHAIRKLGNKPNRLESHHLIQVLFFLNVCRKPPINMYELEYSIEQCFDDLSITEISIMALGFFKTGTPIRNSNLLRRIMTKAIDNINAMDNVSIGAITKLVRFSMQLTEIKTLEKFVDRIVPIEPRLTLMTLNHIAHAVTRVMLYHEEFMNRIIERLNNELSTARLKELERFVYVLTCFNIESNNQVYHNVITELRSTWYTKRANEIQQYPRVISCLLAYLSYVNIYPTDLIERVMMPQHIHNTYRGNYIPVWREYLVLHYGLQVEVPQYNGDYLRPYVHDEMIKKHFQYSKPAESSRGHILLTLILQTCQEIFNNTSDIIIEQPLPQYVIPDVILCLNEQNQLVPIKDHLSKYEKKEVKWMSKEDVDNNKLIALIIGHSGVLIHGTSLPVGHLVSKMRQLVKIGYTPIMVSHIQWKKCQTREQKHNYLKQLLFQDKL